MPNPTARQRAYANPDRWLPYAAFCLFALFVVSQFTRGCADPQDDPVAGVAHVSAQVHSGDSIQVASLKKQAAFLTAEKFHDSIRDVAVQMQLEGLSRAVAQKSDSLAWLRRENQRSLADRERQNSLFLNRFDKLGSDYDASLTRGLDSMRRNISRLEASVSDSALTGRMAKASFEQIYKTASLKNEWFESETLFGKSDSGKDQASVVPLFKNKAEVSIYKYVPPKKGKAGTVGVNVTEANPYAAQGSTNFELSIPALKGKAKRNRAVRHKKSDTRKRQRKNFNKTGG